MPPEVVKQSGHNRYADIWSLGCTVFELLVGKPPWSDNKDIVSVLMSIGKATEPPKLPNKDLVSPNLRNFLEVCFRRDPHLRPNVNELLRHPFILEQPKVAKNLTPPMINI
jgi:serine/threonine protein kinase